MRRTQDWGTLLTSEWVQTNSFRFSVHAFAIALEAIGILKTCSLKMSKNQVLKVRVLIGNFYLSWRPPFSEALFIVMVHEAPYWLNGYCILVSCSWIIYDRFWLSKCKKNRFLEIPIVSICEFSRLLLERRIYISCRTLILELSPWLKTT